MPADDVPVVATERVRVAFKRKRRSGGELVAVRGVSLSIAQGETVGLVGESGSGKSTFARAVLALVPIQGGRVLVRGTEVGRRPGRAKWLRRQAQMVFQDPYSSLNPSMRVASILAEPLAVHGLATGREDVEARVAALLESVGLEPDMSSRFPREFSGGQRQRVSIARALAVDPRFIACDEAVSALDVSVQAQIINLLQDLQEERGLSLLFISHDLGVVRSMSHKVAVLNGGRLVEFAPQESLYERPQHPYTQKLLTAVPEPVPRQRPEAQGPADNGARRERAAEEAVTRRCDEASVACSPDEPSLVAVGEGHYVECHTPAPS